MSGGIQIDGIVASYDDMTHVPISSYNPTNNALLFSNPLQTTEGVASSELEPLEFNSPGLLNSGVQVRFNTNLSEFVPSPLPYDPMSLNIPAINSIGTIQATDLMIAKDGVMK